MFKIGTEVNCTDGRCGKLAKVVVDPNSATVTHLVVEKGFLQKLDRVVPVSVVAETSAARIQLNIDSQELEASFTAYQEEHFRAAEIGGQRRPASTNAAAEKYDPAHVLHWASTHGPPAGSQAEPTLHLKRGVDVDQPVIGKGTPVYDRDGKAGEIAELEVDEKSGQITHLVVNSGLLTPNLLVPMSLVTSISDEGVEVNAHRDELERRS